MMTNLDRGASMPVATYVNFLTEEKGDDRLRAAYGANHDRLAELQAAWDPDNLFRHNKNIAPCSVIPGH